ncbi:Ionotropic glutamate receptor [Dillenia turbinata]|uniref:Ionotropic glutamate receptor n=1 Tax=Dillenia turbinata TaxID=194707 RepID=A0AAN8ZDW5_9MAGN
MDSLEYPLFFFLIGLLVLFSPETIADAGKDHVKNSITLGAIMDNSSRAGQEGLVAMELAIDDINNSPGNVQFSLKIRDSQREPLKAALAAMDLLGKQKVQAILGLSTWAESSLVADRCSQDQVPFLSLSDSTPHWATNRYSFLVQASRDKYAQMKAIAAIVGSYGWKQVIVIYEDIDFATSGIIPQLANALKDEESEIIQLLALKPFASSVAYLSEELERLKMSQARVFVVHSSLSLALNIFKEAKNLGMMEKDCVWITTDSIASQVHSINSASYSSMEGVLGVKTYFHQNGSKFPDFYSKFSQKFHAKYPEEDKNEPGCSALQAYDAVWTLAQAMKGNEMRSQNLLDNISATSFHGLTGTIGFRHRRLASQNLYQIINIYQNRYQELGFWLEGSGFSNTSHARSKYNVTMKSLKPVIWPGGISTDPRGWVPPTKEKPLKIIVPDGATFKEFVHVDTDALGKENFTGLSIDVFEEAVRRLPYKLHYKFFPKNGSYNSLVEQVYLKKYDAVVGDISIVANRCQFVEFTQPYTEGGLVMIVPVKAETSNREWLFMKPFTNGLWILTGAVNVYNGFVVWLIERNYNTELKGSLLTQFGTLIWISFTTLFTLQSDNLHSNLSRWAMVIWLFVALIITQSYTASLTSMLTVQRLIPTVVDVETLKKNNDMVGCAGRSFVGEYLVDVLGFSSDQIKNFTSDDYPEAFHNGQIKAAFLEVPYAKVFLAKHKKEFAAVPPKYEVGGQLGFAFPKKSLFLADLSEAVLNMSESGKLRDLEKRNIPTVEILNIETEDDYDSLRLSYQSFWALFLITAVTSTVSLVIHIIGNKLHSDDAVMEKKGSFGAIRALIKRWKRQKSQLSARVHDGERVSPGKMGCIVDTSSRVGKEEGIAVEMAVEDFNNYFNKSLNLIIKDFQSEPLQAALMAMDLIQVEGVQAILGPNTWEAAALAVQIGNDTQTPILYFGDATPKWAIELWPFLIQASSDHYVQMKAIAAIVQSWKWHQVTILYEDSDSYANGVFPYLSDALHNIDVVVAEFVALPPVSSFLVEVLMRLKEGQCRVFILHSSLELALKIFETAKKMEMMEKNYVWITTDAITNMVHSVDPVSLSFMQGILGVKGYFSESGENIKLFNKRFSERFHAKYPHEENHEPGIFAIHAYDAVWVVGLAVGGSRSSKNIRGQTLLDKILQSNFSGLTKVQFIDQKLPPMQVFQIINIVGRRSYREIGFWLEYAGFLETLKGGGKTYSSMENLEPVIWPRGPKITPKGWTFSSSSNSTLRIGVPTTRFKQFVRAENNYAVQENNFTGLSIDVFKAAIEYLPYPLQYEFHNYSGPSNDDLVKKIYLKEYDAVVGDVGIISKRFQWAEFSHPYTEPGLLMVSPVRPQTSHKAWLFVRPFTVSMWALTGVINVFNGFVVWIIERNHCSELRGPFLNQVGTLLWLAFNTLFSVHALVITQSYLANLTSMLTLQKFEATVKDVEEMNNSKAIIGCGKSSYVYDYLVNVLLFDENRVKRYGTPEEYDEGFRNRSIVAAFMEAPLAKAFPKGSRLVPDMTEAILKVAEQGKLAELEIGTIASETCVEVDSVDDRSSLSPNSFWGLFTITGGCSTIALISYIICHEGKLRELLLECKTTRRRFLAAFKRMHQKKEHLPQKLNDTEIGPSGFAAVQSPVDIELGAIAETL